MHKFDATLNRFGEKITTAVGTMYVAGLFVLLALISLPEALITSDPVIIVAWIAQTFLQLVLLPIIIVGQNVQGAKTEARDIETHDNVMAEHREIKAMIFDVHILLGLVSDMERTNLDFETDKLS